MTSPKAYHSGTLGVLTTAIVTAIDNNVVWAARGLCIASIILAILFSRLDRRNRDLVRAGEALLKHLEGTMIFGAPTNGSTPPKLLLRAEDPLFHPINPSVILTNLLLGKHRFIMPAFAYLFALMFALGLFFIQDKPVRILSAEKQDIRSKH